MSLKSFCILIVNYYGVDDTTECVSSLLDSARHVENDVKILIVDNSFDNFRFSDQSVSILRTGHNVGLSGAWYIGFYSEIAQSCDYVVFLNNDAVVAKDFFRQVQSGCEKWGDDCAFGPRILHASDPDLVWSRGGEIQRYLVKIRHFGENQRADQLETADFETGHLSGCCMIVPTLHLNRIGGPDTNFFFRGEEWDLNYRLSCAGVKLVILDRAEVFHQVNQSHDRFAPKMLYLAYRAKVLFAKKILPWWYFPIWYGLALGYAATVSPVRFARQAKYARSEIRNALVSAMHDGLRNNKIMPPESGDLG